MRKNSITGVSFRWGILAGLLFLSCFLYAVFYLDVPFWEEDSKAARFQKILREYDLLFGASLKDGYLKNYALLERKLEAIAKMEGDQQFSTLQTTLSLLKRERLFARYEKNYRAVYEERLLSAGQKYPQTIQLQALSLENTLKAGIPTVEDALRVGEGRGGDNSVPATAFLQAAAEFYQGKDKEALLVNAALLSIVRETGYREVSAVLYPLDLRQAGSLNTFRFAAEYAYDAGNFALAARLFAALPDDDALERAGDACFLGGDLEGACELWLLSSNANSLYNYAAWSQDIHEQTTALEKILTRYADASRMSFIAAMIRYTRLLDEERAVASLGASSYTAQTPLLDLELWRRTEKNYPPGRAAAEIWRLIGRHIQENALYEYAAWYFGRNRQYEELSLLLKNAGQQGIDSPMLEYWRVLQEARTGETNAGREAFSALSFASGHPWYVSANIGRFYEAERSWKNALDNYYTALADAAENRDKSRILTRMAGCLAALGRSGEAYGVLEEAVSLDPGNLAARSALHNSK